MFSNLSSSSISLATVTPSLVTVGAPKLFSSTTLRPLGPSVTITASARTLTPRRIFSRASWAKRTVLAAMVFASPQKVRKCLSRLNAPAKRRLLEHAQDVVLAQDKMLLAFDLHLAARILAEQNL